MKNVLVLVVFLLTACGGGGGSNNTETNNTDTTPPVIVLTGDATVSVMQGGSYTEQGATCTDDVDATCTVVIGGDTVDPSTVGSYTVTYDAVDAANNSAVQLTRTVNVVVALTAPSVSLSFEQTKTFRFTWADVAGASHYRLLENPDGSSGFNQVGSDIASGTMVYELQVPLYKRLNAQYILQACNTNTCADSPAVLVSGNLVDSIAYIKASNSDMEDNFGFSVSLSDDGDTLAVGAYLEDSGTTGINGNEADNGTDAAGAVYIFTRNGASWSQEAYLKASITDNPDQFGLALSLSADGNTLAVGAIGESSASTTINGSQTDNNANSSGAVYIFIRNGTSWSEEAFIKASNTGSGDLFGRSVSLSDDGNTLAVGADLEDSATQGINTSNGADNGAQSSGAAYVFTRSGTTWSQQAYIKASNGEFNDHFGYALSLSGDGNTLAVGAYGESNSGTGINVNINNNNAALSGAVYVFTRSGASWSQDTFIKASNTNVNDFFGTAVSLDEDGDTLAVGAYRESSSDTGVNGNELDNNASEAGAVYVFTLNGSTWAQQAYLKASNTEAFDYFGESLSLSGDGNTLAVSAKLEDSADAGVNGDEANNNASNTGAVYVFIRDGSSWGQEAYIKASNPDAEDYFGQSLSLNSDGNTLAVGAPLEDSFSKGINGNQAENTSSSSGAAYIY